MPENNNTTIEDLLAKIDKLETMIRELESTHKKLESDNEEIRAFNRKLLDRKVDMQPSNTNDEQAKLKLEKFLKGE